MPQQTSRRVFGLQCAAFLATTKSALSHTTKRKHPLLRVVTYNIHHGEGTDRTFDYERQALLIRELQPDIVALQEVDNRTQRASGIDQAERLAELTGLKHAYGRAMPFDGGEYGIAILSSHPIRSSLTHPLPFRFGQEPRAVLTARIEPTNDLPAFQFASTHLCNQSRETRLEQAKQLNRLFPGTDEQPIVLAGDLNARPNSTVMGELFAQGWVDTIAPDSRIDYVLVRKSHPWRIAGKTIVDDRLASDHRPVCVELEWVPDE